VHHVGILYDRVINELAVVVSGSWMFV